MSMDCRSTGYSDLHAIRGTFHLVACVFRKVESIRWFFFKDTEPFPDLPHRLAIEFCSACAVQHNQHCLSPVCRATKCLPSRQVVYRKRDVLPPGSLRCDSNRTKHSACLISLRLDKHTHICSSSSAAQTPPPLGPWRDAFPREVSGRTSLTP